jgi:hypothetical protein
VPRFTATATAKAAPIRTPTLKRKPTTAKRRKTKFSAKKTLKEVGKAAAASQKDIEFAERPDTTAQEVARMMTEADVAREAERAEAALRTGRKPTREKARYRYRTRGYKRSEGRGR